MRNLWQFIVKNSHLLLFILLEVVAFLLITHYQSYPRATMLTSANHVVAGANQVGDNITSYFHLRQDNNALNDEIVRLQLEVQSLQNRLEVVQERDSVSDSTYYHYAHLGYRIIPAKVIDITTNQEHNYLTLNKGSLDGIASGMGVIEGHNVVGVVSRVNDRFAQVVPLIHTSINLSSRIKKNGQIGFTHWSGHDASHIHLMEIGRHIPVEQGDTVITSGMTATFPEGMLIGVMDKVRLSEGDNYYNIRLHLSTDFRHLRYVQVLDNTCQKQMESLPHE